MDLQEFAQAMWNSFDDGEKTIVRFGMFPAAKMQEAEKAGINGRDLCCALMYCAKKDGGMRA